MGVPGVMSLMGTAMVEGVTSTSARRFLGQDSFVQFDPRRFVALVVLGSVAFAVWLGVIFTVPPHRLLTYLAFLVPFWIAVAAFTAALFYRFFAGRQNAGELVLTSSVSGGAIVASVAVINLSLLASHKWSPLLLLISLVLALAAHLLGWLRVTRRAV